MGANTILFFLELYIWIMGSNSIERAWAVIGTLKCTAPYTSVFVTREYSFKPITPMIADTYPLSMFRCTSLTILFFAFVFTIVHMDHGFRHYRVCWDCDYNMEIHGTL